MVVGRHFFRRHCTDKNELIVQAEIVNALLQALMFMTFTNHQKPKGLIGFFGESCDGLDHEVDVLLGGQARHTDKNMVIRPDTERLPQGFNSLGVHLLKRVVFDARGLHKSRCFDTDHAQIVFRRVSGDDHTVTLIGKALDQRMGDQVAEDQAGQRHEVGVVLKPGVVGVDSRYAQTSSNPEAE